MARIFPYSLKQASVIVAVCCLIAGGVAALERTAGAGMTSRSHLGQSGQKGDQSPSAALAAASAHRPSSATRLSAQPKGPPLGCDPLFSSITDPAKACLDYRRCAV